jgi:hypothetical protein
MKLPPIMIEPPKNTLQTDQISLNKSTVRNVRQPCSQSNKQQLEN